MDRLNKPGELSAREYARGRLWSWGSCIRAVTMMNAPNSNYYSQQPFANIRMNFNMSETEHQQFRGRVWDKAIEVDEVLMPIRELNGSSWAATVVRFVWREPGTAGSRKLAQQYQLLQFHHLTGLGKVTYYDRIKRVEQFVAMSLV